jgi:hypothetical protein
LLVGGLEHGDFPIEHGDFPIKLYGIIVYNLVGGLEHEWIMTFHLVGNVIIPTDELHHFSEGLVHHQPV